MEFKRKLKQRLLVNIGWAVFGLILCLVWMLTDTENSYFLTFGTALCMVGIINIIQYQKNTKDEKAMRQQELAEKDERNRMIDERAKSWAFSFYIMAAGFAVIILSLLGYQEIVAPISYSICTLLIIYCICLNIIRKKY